MRLPLIGLAIGGVLLGQAAALAATSSCVRPAERAALDVEGLKSELMVVALDCDARDHYNSFVNRYKSELNSDEKQLSGYFARAYGRRSGKQDIYNTELANGQSQAGTKQGTLFCQQHMAMFDQVMALRNDDELSEYAAGQELTQPIGAEVCTTPERPAVIRVTARRTRHSKHH